MGGRGRGYRKRSVALNRLKPMRQYCKAKNTISLWSPYIRFFQCQIVNRNGVTFITDRLS